MKKLLLLLAFMLPMYAGHAQTQPHKTAAKKVAKKSVEKVYVCLSGSAYAYHRDKDCRGLRRCKHEIQYEPKTDAVEQGYRACKICY